MKKFQLKMLMISVLFTATAYASQTTVDAISKLHLNYTIKDNDANATGIDCAALGADWGSCNRLLITLTNSSTAIDDKNWAIYFHSIRQILNVENEQFKVTHITGDLHKMEPTEKFTGFPAGQTVSIPIIAEYWQLFDSDIMPRWYVAADDAKPKTIQNTDTEDLRKFSDPITESIWKKNANIIMNPEHRFERNQDTRVLTTSALRGQIIPTPLLATIQQHDVDLATGIFIEQNVFSADTAALFKQRFEQLGVKTDNRNYPINILLNSAIFSGDEAVKGAYQMKIDTNGTEIIAYDESGAFYALQSILSLIPVNDEKRIAAMNVIDAPRFEYRGVFVDVGRNFHSKAAIMRLLDQMAAYKLNKFHFHLTDDEGWRIEIPGLPELTEVGARRCHDLTETNCVLPQLGSGPNTNNMGSGFFTRNEYIEIVKYAKARQIEIIPEVDIPAHARAAVVSMEARYRKLHAAGKEAEANQYRLLDPTDTSRTTSVQFYDLHSYLNPCMASSRNFVDKVIGEMSKMHKEAGQPLTSWHFGGDEAKNIRLGAGFQDKNGKIEPGKGIIDKASEDKPWAKSQACQKIISSGVVEDADHLPSYFAIEVSKIVKSHGINRMQAWQDGLKHAKDSKDFATPRVSVNFWDTLFWGGYEAVNDWAAKGYEVVISNADYVYIDMPYEVDPAEFGYYWATRTSDERKVFSFVPDNPPQNAELSLDRDGKPFSAKSDKPWSGAHGLSAHLWSETVRTDERMEYMMYPRIISIAERAWHRASWEQDYVAGREYQFGKTNHVDKLALRQDWELFSNIMGQRELAKLDKAGIPYRLPLPGARIIDGKMHANIILQGLAIEYSLDNGKSWQRYNEQAKPEIKSDVMIRSVSPDGKRTSRESKLSATL